MKRGREELDDKVRTRRFYNACKDGDVKHVLDFIRTGVDVNAGDEESRTVLHYASLYGRGDVAKVLIQNGADVNAVSKFKLNALHRAAERGRDDIAKVLIQNGADVNAVTKFKLTPLHYAALKGHVDVAKMLIQNGADVNAVDEDKSTALHCAAWDGHVDVAKVLIQNGADVNAVDEDNVTALHRAACDGHVDVAKVLIQNGADVNVVYKYRRKSGTPLHDAAKNRHVVCTLQLLCFGAPIDKKALEDDKTDLLGPINNRMKLLRAGKRPGTSLMSNEERRFMWNLAFSFTIQHRAAAYKTYYTIRSFITFHGIFMAGGYDLDEESVWKRIIEVSSEEESSDANW